MADQVYMSVRSVQSAAEPICRDAMDKARNLDQPVICVAVPIEAFAIPRGVGEGKVREVADRRWRGRTTVARVDVDQWAEPLARTRAVQDLAHTPEALPVEVDAVVCTQS